MLSRSVPVALGLALLAACSGAEKCRVGTDCASGICLSNGECGKRNYPDADLPIHWPDTGSRPDAEQAAGDDASTVEADGSGVTAPDAGADASATEPADATVVTSPDGGLQTCQPNHDGVITKDELPVVLGAKATFLVAHDVAVNTVGVQQADGTWVWDLSGALNGDSKIEFSPKPLAGQWFAADFPGAEFTLRMAGSADTLGVLQSSVDGLLLHGMASPASSASATNVRYLKDDYSGDPSPILSVAYPVQTGKSWTSAGVLDGDYDGSTYHCDPTLVSCTPMPNCCIRHVYDSSADKAGEVVTPLGTFEVVRIKNVIDFEVLTYGVWYGVQTVRSYVFVSECFGTVASITAKVDETEEEFTSAAEVRRLSP